MPAPRNTAIRDRHRATIARGKPPCGICGDTIDYSLTVAPGEHGKRCTGPTCTGCVPHPMSYVVDHVIPVNRGGPDILANKQAAHRMCNRAKSDRTDGGPILRRSGSLTRPNRT
ncbi:HNH endonuclease [Micromonospora sp. NPDC023644]|uniref:HNH endonuclease n=1 Tax=Micromonospora sp. NPDC023644 TaxID=3154321 RepID=UPI0033F60774